jgi:diaminohydroxyphosphoribosylaminopyrimidine deaminase/5-amino-6-(5-phosphoribosylamino)uracil reductase
MRLALALGRRGLGQTWPNPAVGAVIAKDGIIVGRGWTQPGGRPHAETEAIRRAGEAARGATMYVTLEPCSHHGKTPPCADAIIAAGIARVVSALADPNPLVAGEGYARLRAAGIVVDTGVAADEAKRAHAGHLLRMRDRRPHVTLKIAMSADGRVGLSGRRPVQITGDLARARVHVMRAMSDAVLTGIGTAQADNPLLTCRLPGLEDRSPWRVVLDSALSLSTDSRLVATARAVPLLVVAAPTAPSDRERVLRAEGVEVMRSEAGEGGLALLPILRALADKGMTRLMVEAGPRIAVSFLRAALVDELVLFRAPVTVGDGGIDAFEGIAFGDLAKAGDLRLRHSEAIGSDTVETYERDGACSRES